MPEAMLTPKQLAATLGVTTKTLENWRRTGTGPPFTRLSYGVVRYAEKSLSAWLAERERRSTAEDADRESAR